MEAGAVSAGSLSRLLGFWIVVLHGEVEAVPGCVLTQGRGAEYPAVHQ